MNKPIIENYAGRGPQLPSSRITVYDVMDYYLDGWPAGRIANWLSQPQDEIEAAIEYIEAHRDEVDPEYRKMLERCERGNPPELQAKIDALRPLARAKMAEIVRKSREAKMNGAGMNGSHG